MTLLTPASLDGVDAETIAREYIGAPLGEHAWWDLKRVDDANFTWRDKRLGLDWRVSQGYLVALHEVSTLAQAREFARRNNIRLLPDGGLIFRGNAELFIRCAPIDAPDLLRAEADLFRVRTASGIEAAIGYSSPLFNRLVARPFAELNERLPEPSTLTTLTLWGVSLESVSKLAEVVLYHLRKNFLGVHFSFQPLSDYSTTPDVDEATQPTAPALIDAAREPVHPEAVAFYNRAQESDPIAGFLYYYRVVEACFDIVLDAQVNLWRSDATMTHGALLKNVRHLQRREDVWSLRRVLGELVTQRSLDELHTRGLIPHATADSLTDEIYARRNSIAHGRRGQHLGVLVPNYFTSDDDRAKDREWYKVIGEFASAAMMKWILVR